METRCAWCGEDLGAGVPGSHGICDSCIEKVFGVNPATIHADIASDIAAEQSLQSATEAQETKISKTTQTFRCR